MPRPAPCIVLFHFKVLKVLLTCFWQEMEGQCVCWMCSINVGTFPKSILAQVFGIVDAAWLKSGRIADVFVKIGAFDIYIIMLYGVPRGRQDHEQ